MLHLVAGPEGRPGRRPVQAIGEVQPAVSKETSIGTLCILPEWWVFDIVRQILDGRAKNSMSGFERGED